MYFIGKICISSCETTLKQIYLHFIEFFVGGISMLYIFEMCNESNTKFIK